MYSEREATKLIVEARKDLSEILPPQSEKLITALQNIRRALHYFELDGCREDGLGALRAGLAALNQIEKPIDLPPNVRLTITKVLGALVRALRLFEAEPVRGSDHIGRGVLRPDEASLSVDDTTINCYAGTGNGSPQSAGVCPAVPVGSESSAMRHVRIRDREVG
jgi:hypothetical protein